MRISLTFIVLVDLQHSLKSVKEKTPIRIAEQSGCTRGITEYLHKRPRLMAMKMCEVKNEIP
jgi:hypothetical protein